MIQKNGDFLRNLASFFHFPLSPSGLTRGPIARIGAGVVGSRLRAPNRGFPRRLASFFRFCPGRPAWS